MKTYARLWRLLLWRPGTLALALVGMAGAAAATGIFAALTGPALKLLFTGGTAPPWLSEGFGGLRSFVTSRTPAQVRVGLPLALLAVATARAGFSYLQASQMAKLCLRTVAELQERLHRALLDLPLSYFQGRHSGEVFARLTGDLGDVERALTQGITYGLRDGFQLTALIWVSVALDFRLFLFGALTLPLGVFAIARFARSLRFVSAALQDRQAALLSQAQDFLSGATVLQVYRAQGAALRAEGRAEDGWLALGRRLAALRAAVTPTVEFLGFLALAVVLLGLHHLRAEVPPEKVVSFLGAVLLAYQPLKSISSNSQWIVPGLTAAERLFGLLDAPPAISDLPDAKPVPRAHASGAELVFDGVDVSYGQHLALARLDLRIAPGERVAIVGSSGSGKSTLLHLAPRLLDPARGRVMVNGADVRHVTLRSLRAQIALVGQEVFLFDASVEENLSMGRAHPPGALEAALEAAGATEFVNSLPQGLGTRLGERGLRLSGGQRQRLSLARALLKSAPLLLLDEAMSALDPPLEAALMKGLCDRGRGATLVLVTHRLQSAAELDRIVVLEAGQVVETGRPDELPADGWFLRTLREQSSTRSREGS